MRARRDEMRLQDGMHLVLDPGPMPNDLVAATHQSAQALGIRVGYPDLRQEARCPQRRQHACVDLVCLDVSMCDRLHLQRIGYDHSRNIRAEHPHHRHRVAGCLDDDLVFLAQAATKPLKPRAGHIYTPARPEPTCLPENHLRESAVDVHADHALHLLLLSPVV
jgi:hypothetical protein